MDLLIILNLNYGSFDPYSCLYCKDCHRVFDSISELSGKFSQCLIINDNHSIDDPEFKYLPLHSLIGTSHQYPYETHRIKCPIHFLSKTTLSAFPPEDKHNTFILKNLQPDNIYLTGFALSTDIIPTAISLVDLGYNVKILRSCVGDIKDTGGNRLIEFLGLYD